MYMVPPYQYPPNYFQYSGAFGQMYDDEEDEKEEEQAQ